MSALRASSLAAVTIFVWSTSEKPSSCVSRRTSWRASTMSCSDLSGVTPLAGVDICAIRVDLPAQHGHAPLHVESSCDTRQRQSELDQRDGDGRLHSDEDRLGAEDLPDARDVAHHPADERIDHL